MALWSGVLNPRMRIFHYSSIAITMIIGSWCNGYATSRIMKYFGHGNWNVAAKFAAFFFPLWIFLLIICVDLLDWFERAVTPYPLSSVVLYALLWMAFAIPASFHGSYIGFI